MATKYWIGAAQAINQVTTITFSAYTIGVVYRVTINNKTVSYTAAVATGADVWSGLMNAWNSSGIPEHQEMVASVNSGLVLTGRDAGVPVTITASSSGAPTATVTPTTAADGPNFLMTAANWVGGVAPAAGEDLVFKNSNVDVLYGLENTGTNFGNITVEASYTGSIGLPPTNQSGGYPEYRPRYLKLGSGAQTYTLTVGAGQGNQPNKVYVDANSANVTLIVYGSGQASLDSMPIELKNTGATAAAQVYAGAVAIKADTTGTLASLSIVSNSNVSVQPQVIIGAGVTVTSAKQAGQSKLLNYGTITTIDVTDGGEYYNYSLTPTARAATNGRIYWVSSSNLTTKAVAYNQGVIDFSKHGSAKSCQACDVYSGGQLYDPLGLVTFTTGIKLVGAKISEVTLDVGRDKTLEVA